MGPCKICGALGCYGFQPPGPRKDRTEHWQAWACPEHREQVEAEWLRYTRGDDRETRFADARQHETGNNSEFPKGSRGPEQGRLL